MSGSATIRAGGSGITAGASREELSRRIPVRRGVSAGDTTTPERSTKMKQIYQSLHHRLLLVAVCLAASAAARANEIV